MNLHRLLLATLLLLMPIVAIIDGLAMAPMAGLLFVLLAWEHRGALAHWRSIYPAYSCGIAIVLLLTIWPLLTSLWSIIPQDSFVTALRSAGFLILALLGAFLAGQDREKTNPTLWTLPAIGIALSVLIIFSGELPGGGMIPLISDLLRHDQYTYLSKDINRGLCALSVLVWPAVLGLSRVGGRNSALQLPWMYLLMLFALHNLSAKTGMIAGLAVFYGMLFWPRIFRRLLIVGVPLLFIAWPILFYFGEPLLRASLYDSLPDSSKHRVEIWHFVLSKWQERPWLGWGVDSSRAIPGGLVEFRPGLVFLPLHPHNLPLHVLLEQGIIGFGLFVAALILFVRRILRVDSSRPPMAVAAGAATLVSYLTIGMSGFGMWQSWWEMTGVAAFLMVAFAGRAVAEN